MKTSLIVCQVVTDPFYYTITYHHTVDEIVFVQFDMTILWCCISDFNNTGYSYDIQVFIQTSITIVRILSVISVSYLDCLLLSPKLLHRQFNGFHWLTN